MLSMIRRHLSLKIIGALASAIALTFFLMIFLNIRGQNTLVEDLAEQQGHMIAETIEEGSSEALAVGNNDSVRHQFRRLAEKFPTSAVYIFDFHGLIAFATNEGALGRNVREMTVNQKLLENMDMVLAGASEKMGSLDRSSQENPYFTVIKPIHNEQRCHHCHGKSREVLGGIMVMTSLKAVDRAVTLCVGRNILIGLAGLALLVTLIFLLTRSLVLRPIRRLVHAADAVAAGDLEVQTGDLGQDEIGRLGRAMAHMTENLKAGRTAVESNVRSLEKVLDEVSDAAGRLDEGSSQVADSSHNLSTGAARQSTALEETASTMNQIASQTKENAQNAAQADEYIKQAVAEAVDGVERMKNLTQAVNSIQTSSREAVKIIRNIDDISFQTNLLALNAAVEAARAGKSGKGFAVVAEEVRHLAARSAKAAGETARTLEDSAKKIEEGARFAQETAQALEGIVNGVSKAAELMAQIAQASREQASGIDQINQGLAQIESVTQDNNEHAEKTAQAASGLASMAADLKKLMASFQNKTDHKSVNDLEEPIKQG